MTSVQGLDHVTVAIQILRGGVTGEVVQNMFGGKWERPVEEFRTALPIVLVRAVPGSPARMSYLPVGNYSFDTFTYDESAMKAIQTDARVFQDLLLVQSKIVTYEAQSTLVRSVSLLSGPSQLDDPDVNLPFIRRSWQMLVDDMEVS